MRNKFLYRKIYKQYYGPIPIDEEGRHFDIHHIDGNCENNDPSNLKALTIQEHYDVHYNQHDWGACFRLAQRMKLSPIEISDLATKRNLKNGIWQGDNNPSRIMIKNGTSPLLKENGGSKIARERANQMVGNGTHNWVGQDNKKHNQKMLENGTHPFLGKKNPNNIKIECPYCYKIGTLPSMKRWHFDRCKENDII